MKYRAEVHISAYDDNGISLGVVYESASKEIFPEGERLILFPEGAWEDIERLALKSAEVGVMPPIVIRAYWGINDFRGKPVPGTRAMTKRGARFFFIQKKRIKWWWFQQRFGYSVEYFGPAANKHNEYCRCVECEGY